MKTNKIATIAAAGLLALTVAGCGNNTGSIKQEDYENKNNQISFGGTNFYAERELTGRVMKLDQEGERPFAVEYISEDAPVRYGRPDSLSTYTLSDSAQMYIGEILRLTDRLEYQLVKDRLEQRRRHDINN